MTSTDRVIAMRIIILFIFIPYLIQANECQLLTGAPEHMREICKMQNRAGCKMMEKQMNCYWSSVDNGMCALAEGAPKSMSSLCQIQDYQGCKMMEEKGQCYWKPTGQKLSLNTQ